MTILAVVFNVFAVLVFAIVLVDICQRASR